MKANSRKWITSFWVVVAVLALGAMFYLLVKSGSGSIGMSAPFSATSGPDLVEHQPTGTPAPYAVTPSELAYVPPSMRTPIPYPYPYPISAPNASATASEAGYETFRASAAKTLTAEPTMNVASQTALAEENAAYLQETIKDMKRLGAIMLEDNGRTYTYTLTNRFFVFLDDEKYPVDGMKCEPKPVIGSVTSGSFRGRGLYPIYYDASIVGSCTLKNHDFAVKIVVVDIPTPVLTPP
ncbi:MAG: hypothetical protein P8Z00_22860 [Anaerolineales bacterium]|jgi:hypothetical protein